MTKTKKKMKMWGDAGRGRGSVLLLCVALLTLSLSCAGVGAQVRIPTHLMTFTVEPHDILPHPLHGGAPSIHRLCIYVISSRNKSSQSDAGKKSVGVNL